MILNDFVCRIYILMAPLNVEAPEFTPTRKVSKTLPKQQQQGFEAAEYYPASLLREAVSIVNEKLKLEKKVATREDSKSELARQIFSDPARLPCERALIGGELFDEICDVGGAGRIGDFPLHEMVGAAAIRTVIQKRTVREFVFVLGVCRMRTSLRPGVGVGVVQENLDEEQFYAEENYRLRQSAESMMQEILKLRFEMRKQLELISDMKTEIRRIRENIRRNNNQRMVMIVPPPSPPPITTTTTTTPHYEIARPRSQGNPPIPTPMVGHLLNRRRLRDKQIDKF